MRSVGFVYLVSCCLALASTGGSSSIVSRATHEPHRAVPGHRVAHLYLGVREGAKSVSDSSNSWVTRSVFAIDLPLSGVVDTLLVPFDLAFAQRHAYQAEEERRSSVGATAPSLSDAAVSGRYVPATF